MTRADIPKIPSSEITPEHVYINRRQFMRGVGLAAGALAVAYRHKPKEKEVATPTIRQERDDPAFAIVEPNVAPENFSGSANEASIPNPWGDAVDIDAQGHEACARRALCNPGS